MSRHKDLDRELAEARAEQEATMRERVAAREELEQEGARWARPTSVPPPPSVTPMAWWMEQVPVG